MKNLSLKSKLLSLSAFLVTISGVIGGVSYWGLQQVIHNYVKIADVNYPNTASTLEMYSNFRSNRLQALNIVSAQTSNDDKKAAVKRMMDNFKTDKELDVEYRSVPYQPGEEVLYEEFRKYVDEGNADFKELAETFEKNKGDQESLDKMNEIVFKKIASAGNKMREPIEKLKKFHFDAADVSKAQAQASAAMVTKLSIALILILGSIGLVAAYFFSNVLTKSLKTISEILDDSSTQVSGAAGQIASAAEELSQAVTEQSASLQETSASVEELSSMVKVNSENAKKASDNSNVSKNQAEKGQAVVDEMVQSMAMINDSNNNIMNQINHSNEQMSEIVKVIQEIETKTKVINDIVFQTKLLSFNASVEAARAGEQGKGFAVVAEEVGNLAQMSGNAAKEISDMLSASMSKVEAIVVDTKSKVDVLVADGKEKVKNGTRVAEECGAVLKEIVSNVSNVATMASEISVASDEQSRGIVEITKAMGQLDQVTQSNSATSDEAAHAAGELSAQADTLKNQVVSLCSLINGGGKNQPMISKSVVKEKKMEVKAEKKVEVATSNVLPMKKPEDVVPAKKMEKAPAAKPLAKAATPAPAPKNAPKVKTPEKVVAKTEASTFKKASGGDLGLPSHDHPGFEDV